MAPKMRCSGLAFVLLLIAGCNTETSIKDEKPDPVLVEYPVVYIERDIVTVEEEDDQELARFSAREPTLFNPGANILFKKNAFVDSPVSNLTALLFEDDQLEENQRIDVRDLTVSDDGQQFLVSIRAPEIEDADEDEQPKWNIWRYQLSTGSLERVITSDVTAEQGDDLMPSFLPDGRIVFASTRQRLSRAILLDEGKPQYTALDERRDNEAFNIHVMKADGTSIEQLTFNLSHDFYPLVLQDGHILYSRWDTMGGNNTINLYRMLPDGTENQLVFGWHSHQLTFDEQVERVEFIKPQQMPNGDILMMLASSEESVYQKRPVIININDYIDQEQSVAGSNVQGEAITDLFTGDTFEFNFSQALSMSGRISHLYPLPDVSERFLISWDLCRVVLDELVRACGQLSEEELADESLEMAQPLYELWLFNKLENTQQLVASTDTGKMLTEAIVMQPSSQAKEFIADKTVGNELDAELFNDLAAAIHIRSVYDFDGQDSSISDSNPQGINRLRDPSLTSADDLPARFLRVVRGVPMPPEEVRDIMNTDFGRSNNQLMREIIGYTPIQPDGSVKVKIPANIPVALSILDANGQRIGGRHRQWITLKAGETLECQGCHTSTSTLPHGRVAAQALSINNGAPVGGSPFPNATDEIIPELGQTMAQADEMMNGLAELEADINYQDIWSNPAISMVNQPISYVYEELTTLAPNGSDCFEEWNTYCRIQINYAEHIHPLWEVTRQVFDPDTLELLADNTCTSCHGVLDADSLAQVPAGQVDLSGAPSSDEPEHLTSYRELFFNDVEQEVVDGILLDRLVEVLDENGNIVFEVDADGELILDVEGNPIPVLTTVNVNPTLSTNSASASGRFFEAINNDTHRGMLSSHELKLLSEWLDIGAQYYNTPFYLQD